MNFEYFQALLLSIYSNIDSYVSTYIQLIRVGLVWCEIHATGPGHHGDVRGQVRSVDHQLPQAQPFSFSFKHLKKDASDTSILSIPDQFNTFSFNSHHPYPPPTFSPPTTSPPITYNLPFFTMSCNNKTEEFHISEIPSLHGYVAIVTGGTKALSSLIP